MALASAKFVGRIFYLVDVDVLLHCRLLGVLLYSLEKGVPTNFAGALYFFHLLLLNLTINNTISYSFLDQPLAWL